MQNVGFGLLFFVQQKDGNSKKCGSCNFGVFNHVYPLILPKWVSFERIVFWSIGEISVELCWLLVHHGSSHSDLHVFNLPFGQHSNQKFRCSIPNNYIFKRSIVKCYASWPESKRTVWERHVVSPQYMTFSANDVVNSHHICVESRLMLVACSAWSIFGCTSFASLFKVTSIWSKGNFKTIPLMLYFNDVVYLHNILYVDLILCAHVFLNICTYFMFV